MKLCLACLIQKPYEGFYPHKSTKDGYRCYCKECVKAKVNAKRAEDPEAARAAERARYDANPAASQARSRKWKQDNPEAVAEYKVEYRATHVEETRIGFATWAAENHAKRTATEARRKAAKLQATPEWANAFFIEEAYDLAQRRTATTGFEWHVDHAVPLKSKLVCGLHVEFNLEVIPGVENLRKGNRTWPDMP